MGGFWGRGWKCGLRQDDTIKIFLPGRIINSVVDFYDVQSIRSKVDLISSQLLGTPSRVMADLSLRIGTSLPALNRWMAITSSKRPRQGRLEIVSWDR